MNRHLLDPATRDGILYLTGCTNALTAAAARRQPRLGALAQPGNAVHLQHSDYRFWGIDNGAFGHARKVAMGTAAPWGDAETASYLTYLRKVTHDVDVSAALFATAPDVLSFVCLRHDVTICKLGNGRCEGVPIGDAVATWKRSSRIFARIRKLGLLAALVAQDGINDLPIDYDAFDVLFLGGSDGFKLGPEGELATQRAKAAGKWVHMGRVNSLKRLEYAATIGCDSADGTFVRWGVTENVPEMLSWLDVTQRGVQLMLAA